MHFELVKTDITMHIDRSLSYSLSYSTLFKAFVTERYLIQDTNVMVTLYGGQLNKTLARVIYKCSYCFQTLK